MTTRPHTRALPYASGTLAGRVAALKSQLASVNDGGESIACNAAIDSILEAAVAAERTILNQRELISELQCHTHDTPLRLRSSA